MLRGHYACDNERRDGLIAILSLTIRTGTEEKDDEEGFKRVQLTRVGLILEASSREHVENYLIIALSLHRYLLTVQ